MRPIYCLPTEGVVQRNFLTVPKKTSVEHNPVLLGYDVVHYHKIPSVREGGVALRGVPDHAFNWEGYQFWFASEENRALFISDPWKVGDWLLYQMSYFMHCCLIRMLPLTFSTLPRGVVSVHGE